MADLITIDEFKALMGITTSDYDASINASIPMVSSYIQSYLGRNFGVAGYTERRQGIVDHLGRFFFQMKNTPVISVSDIALHYYGVSADIAVDVDRLDLLGANGIAYYVFTPDFIDEIVLRPEYRSQFYYDITYSGGETVPHAVKLASANMMHDLLEYYKRTNSMLASGQVAQHELRSVQIGDYRETYSDSESLFTKFANGDSGLVMTQTVKDLLAPYKKLTVGIG